MNNATIALNVARPPAPAPSSAPGAANPSSVTGQGNDDTASHKRFDAAMDAAHADARKTKDQSSDKNSTTSTSTSTSTSSAKDASTDKTASTQATDKKSDDDATKKDDSTDGDTSLATSVLALIGVPPKVTDVAAKALATVTATAGKALGALTGTGATPGLAAAADAAAGVKDGAGAGLTVMDSLATTAPVAVAPASPFASLLAAQGGDLSVSKDDASATDTATASPMPLLHAPAMAGVAAPAVQVQATQAATSPQFGQELGEQIAWMGSGDVKSARIKLHPEELGSMDVHVTMDGGKVNVAILAQHPAAVHAVQQTLSQLDSMLAHHGLSLGQADVGQRQPGQNAGQGSAAAGQGDATPDEATAGTVATSRVSRSLVDEVA